MRTNKYISLKNRGYEMLDREGRNIDYLRVSLTENCNLRCIYCMPNEPCTSNSMSSLGVKDLNKIIRAFSVLGIKKVRFTGGEPLLVKELDKIIYNTSKICNIDDIAITTNGMLLEQMATDLKNCGLKRVNLSLDTLDSKNFKLITRYGELSKVEAAINKCLSLGLDLKINTVLIKGINDNEIDDLINLTKILPITLRFIELMPIGEGEKFYKKGIITSKEVLENRLDLIPLANVHNSTATLYKLPNSKGQVGFISPISCKFCYGCNRIRITSKGGIKPCLHSNQEIDLKPFFINDLALVTAIRDIIYEKPKEHNLKATNYKSIKYMYQIGG